MDGRVREERSLGELFGDLTDDVRMLLRQEVALARTEVSDKVAHLSRDGMRIGVGGARRLGLSGPGGDSHHCLDLIIPLWLSALLVGAVLYRGLCADHGRMTTSGESITIERRSAH